LSYADLDAETFEGWEPSAVLADFLFRLEQEPASLDGILSVDIPVGDVDLDTFQNCYL